MDKGFGYFVVFALGVVVGVFLVVFPLTIGEPVNSVNELPKSDEVYKVKVDDVTFTCRTKPDIKDNKIKLWNCKELFGDLVVIKSFHSYSVAIELEGD